MILCPVIDCDSDAYRSQRGCRKHVSVKHGWYYYFDKKPKIEDSFPEHVISRRPKAPIKLKTWNIPSFPEKCKVGQDFTNWICSPGGGGKDRNQASQICKKILKYLRFCCQDVEESFDVTNTILEYCLGSVNYIESFIKFLEEEWKVGKPGLIAYLHSFSHALDYLRYQGMQVDKLSTFMSTEVFLARAKQCLRKKMRVEWNTLLSIEHLESLNCWATLTELQRVVPFHKDKYNQIILNVKSTGSAVSTDLTFATSFIICLLFLKVKGARPMTFQYLTVQMLHSAYKSGMVDQTTFKTEEKYGFDTLIFSDEVLQLIKTYTEIIRPKLKPSCNYLLLCRNGNQLNNLGDIFGRMVYQAIRKYINPTRYRQIIETESVQSLTAEEQAVVSLDQKHTSNVAKVHYQKQRSRNVAKKSSEYIQKLIEIGENERVDFEREDSIEKDSEIRPIEKPKNIEDVGTSSVEKPKELKEISSPMGKRQKRCLFSKEEDNFLIKGLKKYGPGRWSDILKDSDYRFHSSRKNSTLMMRAKAKKFI